MRGNIRKLLRITNKNKIN